MHINMVFYIPKKFPFPPFLLLIYSQMRISERGPLNLRRQWVMKRKGYPHTFYFGQTVVMMDT